MRVIEIVCLNVAQNLLSFFLLSAICSPTQICILFASKKSIFKNWHRSLIFAYFCDLDVCQKTQKGPDEVQLQTKGVFELHISVRLFSFTSQFAASNSYVQ
jgi:hypothetical protein